MMANEGNQFWLARATHGRKKTFSSPDHLWESCCEYFQYQIDHPWNKKDFIKGGDSAGSIVDLPTTPPFTWQGLATFLDIDVKTLWDYQKADSHKDFHPIMMRVGQIIYRQKFEGASVGAYNASIIARDLNLVEKSQHDHLSGGKEIKGIIIHHPKEEE